jgi:hypothetical protein
MSVVLVVASSACHDDRLLGEVAADAGPLPVDRILDDVADAALLPVDSSLGEVADARLMPVACGGGLCDGWCERPEGHCEISSVRGICRPHIPADERDAFLVACARGMPHVTACGCNGQFFASDCDRQLAEVSLFSSGRSCPAALACLDRTDCGVGEFCDFLDGRCSSPGVCRPGGVDATAVLCDADSGSVCGCDGKTYASECDRHRAGVSKAPGPPCQTR